MMCARVLNANFDCWDNNYILWEREKRKNCNYTISKLQAYYRRHQQKPKNLHVGWLSVGFSGLRFYKSPVSLLIQINNFIDLLSL